MKKWVWILSCCAVMPLVSSCMEHEDLSMKNTCRESATRCYEDIVMQCNADHEWVQVTDCRSSNQVCRAEAQGAVCRAQDDVTPSEPDDELCGEAGVVCGEGEVCVNDECVTNSCTDGLRLCATPSGNQCMDIKGMDAENCGGCSYRCADHPQAHAKSDTCANGRCEYTCDEPYINIGTATAPKCTDLKTDAQNCGAKGNACGEGEVCVGGSCAKNSCADGLRLCATMSGNVCIDINGADAENCGGCGYVCSAHPQAHATSNICVNGRCEYTCDESYTNIGTATEPNCTDLKTDAQNCGAKGNTCGDGEVCMDGACVKNECMDGYRLCSTPGGNMCFDINGTNAANCGGCGYVCSEHPQAHATSNTCVSGQCEYTCDEPYTNIGTATSPKCTDLKNDDKNCGAKGKACGDGEVCMDGACVKNECMDGYRLCSTPGGNMCFDINGTNAANCGGCGYVCSEHPQAHATSNTCVNGQCEYTCDEPYTNIGTATEPKCTNLDTDVKNCGAKGTTCDSGEVCVDGACVKNSCTNGLMLCSTESGNACIDINDTDAKNCGGCGYVCSEHPLAHATSNTCVSGQCEYTCDEPYTNIGTERAPHCVDVKVNPNHCGAAGNDCFLIEHAEVTFCQNGACGVYSCQEGYHIYEDTCEANDLDNCGEHGAACDIENSVELSCATGVCEVKKCERGYHLYNNTCERDSIEHCGIARDKCDTVLKHGKDVCKVSDEGASCQLQCNDKYHLYDKVREDGTEETVCEEDTIEHCGVERDVCGVADDVYATPVCIKYSGGVYRCSIVCDNGHSYNGKCEPDTADNCGSHGYSCSMLPFAVKTECDGGTCKVLSCEEGFHVYGESICERDDNNHCGKHGVKCNTSTIFNSASVACESGQCKATSCVDGYSIVDGKCKNENCRSNADCSGETPVCELMAGSAFENVCVQCKKDSDCPSIVGGSPKCISNTCDYQCESGYAKCGPSEYRTETRCLKLSGTGFGSGNAFCEDFCGDCESGQTCTIFGECR